MSRHKKRKPKGRRFTKDEMAIRRAERLVKLDEKVLKVIFREKPVSVPKERGVLVKVTGRKVPKRDKQRRKAERAEARAKWKKKFCAALDELCSEIKRVELPR